MLFSSPLHVAAPPSSESLSPSIPPWAAWEVDEKSLRCINQWNLKYQDNKFSTVVLGCVNGILESKAFEIALAFIPDNPVPANSLVKALVSLALLVSVSKESQKFSCITQHPLPENSRSKTRSLRL